MAETIPSFVLCWHSITETAVNALSDKKQNIVHVTPTFNTMKLEGLPGPSQKQMNAAIGQS